MIHIYYGVGGEPDGETVGKPVPQRGLLRGY